MSFAMTASASAATVRRAPPSSGTGDYAYRIARSDLGFPPPIHRSYPRPTVSLAPARPSPPPGPRPARENGRGRAHEGSLRRRAIERLEDRREARRRRGDGGGERIAPTSTARGDFFDRSNEERGAFIFYFHTGPHTTAFAL